MQISLYSNPMHEKLVTQAMQEPNRQLIVDARGRSISSKDIVTAIDAIAADLISLGVKKGERVIFLAQPSIESILYFFALLRVGATIVLVDPEMGQENFISRISFSKASWMLQDAILEKIETYTWIKPVLRFLHIWFPEHIPVERKITIKKLRQVGSGFEFVGKTSEHEVKEIVMPLNTEMVIIFTSGTVSHPKGVVHTYQSLTAALETISKEISISRNDFLYASQFYFLLIGLMVSAKTYIPKGRTFNLKHFVNVTSKYPISSAFLLPYEGEVIHTYYKRKHMLLPESFKTILFGSAPVTKGFLSRFAEVCHASLNVFGVYGATEMLPISTVNMKYKLAYTGDGDLLGKPAHGVQVKVSDEGELLVTGPQQYETYLGDEMAATHFATGDLGKIDSDGNIVLLGRKKDMIIKKGFNIYPGLFESVISKIPGVIESSFIGVYDDSIADEKVVLFVVLNEEQNIDETSIASALKSGQYSIDTYAYPDKIIVIDAMPRSGRSRKIDKVTLRNMATQSLEQKI
jgi:acyl-coenzyme A synthetase/AMP-(fatty) acid ligase